MGQKRRLRDPDLYAIAAAYLRGLGRSQGEVAALLHVSQAAVSRLLKRSVAKRCLRVPTPVFNCPRELEPLWHLAQSEFFPSAGLLESLRAQCLQGRSALNKVVVVHGTVEESFGPAVVPVIRDVIARSRNLGVTWGRTLGELIETLKDYLDAPVRAQDPVTIFPLCGEPLKDRSDPLSFSSSALAARLHELVNGPSAPLPASLAGVPTIIPRRGFDDADTDTIRRFINLFAGYSRVFGDGKSKGLVHEADTIVTSVGVVEGRRGIFLKERVEVGDVKEEELVEWLVGDIGGVLIPRAGLKAREARAVELMNARWTGISREGLYQCARRAEREKRPGVVVVGVGERRIDLVLRIVEENLASELVIDGGLADGLGKRLKSDARAI